MIVVLLFLLGLFYWGCIAVGQVIVLVRSPDGTRWKRSAIYWGLLLLISVASFLHPVSAMLVGLPVIMVASLPLLLIPGGREKMLQCLELFTS